MDFNKKKIINITIVILIIVIVVIAGYVFYSHQQARIKKFCTEYQITQVQLKKIINNINKICDPESNTAIYPYQRIIKLQNMLFEYEKEFTALDFLPDNKYQKLKLCNKAFIEKLRKFLDDYANLIEIASEVQAHDNACKKLFRQGDIILNDPYASIAELKNHRSNLMAMKTKMEKDIKNFLRIDKKLSSSAKLLLLSQQKLNKQLKTCNFEKLPQLNIKF